MVRSFSHNCYKSKDNSSARNRNVRKSEWFLAAGNYSLRIQLYSFFFFLRVCYRRLSTQEMKMQMYEQMHILSPLVPPREFYFLRHCQQIELGMWVIVDVSYECPKEKSSLPSRSWRLPSGCMIQDLPNGCSKVRNFKSL